MAEKIHQILKPDVDDKTAKDYVKNNLTAQEYKDLLLGNYGHGSYTIGELPWKESEHNNPKNNKAIFDAMRGKEEGREGLRLENFLSGANLDDKTIQHIIDKTSRTDDTFNGLSQNKALSGKQLHGIAKELVENQPDEDKTGETLQNVLAHPNASQDTADYIAQNVEKIRTPRGLHTAILKSQKPSEKALEQRLENTAAGDTESLDAALGRMPEAYRKEFIDRKLGIKGGKHADDMEDEENPFNPETAAWGEDQWVNGRGRTSDRLAANLAGSKHLTDAQAEHIKRYGDHDQKMALFHNENLDPKHAKEMWEKWHNDDSDEGYDQEKFKEELKDRHLDDLRQNVYDSGEPREAAEEDYPFDDYIQDLRPEDIFGRRRRSGDYEEDYRNFLKDKEDWTGEHPDYDKKLDEGLEDLEQHKDRLGYITGKQFQEWQHPQKERVKEHIENNHYFDSSDPEDTVDLDEVRKDHDEKHNPKEIDYANNENYSITDHPEYDERYDDRDNFKRFINSEQGDGLRDQLYDGYYDSISESEAQHADRMVDEKADELPYDYDYLPGHLNGQIDYINRRKEIEEENHRRELSEKAAKEEADNQIFLDQAMPQRSKQHDFAPHMHHLQMIKDHAEANGGTIGVDKMNRAYPNLKEVWKKHFDKPKLTQEEIQSKIDAMPKTSYNVSFTKWGENKMQNSTKSNQVVLRLDHSPDSKKVLESDPRVKEEFDKIAKMSQASGHPVNPDTIGWARIDTSDPKHWVIDELQSDLENKGIRPMLEKAAKENGEKPDEGRINALEKINDLHGDWRENLLTAVKNHAKANGVETIATHSPESKANHTGADTEHTVYKESYHRAPRQLGFVAQHVDQMPVPEAMKQYFNQPEERVKDAIDKHSAALDFHLEHAAAHKKLAGEQKTSHTKEHEERMQYHMDMARQHQKRIAEIDPERSKGRRSLESMMGSPEQEYLRVAEEGVKEGRKPMNHDHDALLKKPAGEGKLHGHVLELNPVKLKEKLLKSEELELSLFERLTALRARFV